LTFYSWIGGVCFYTYTA